MSGTDRIAVIIASSGRPAELQRWTSHIARQTLKPVEMIWAVTSESDLPPGAAGDHGSTTKFVIGNRGLTKQRNAALDAIGSSPDIVAFFDDDYVPSKDCLRGIADSFERLPHVVGLSGRLLADGIGSAGVEYAEAAAMIDRHDARHGAVEDFAFERTQGLYGCNMVYRAQSIGDVRFDERLPLYGWQEDWDFAVRMSRGQVVGKTNGFTGLHQGVKRGRTSGECLGYSQIANPVYLNRKGSMGVKVAATLMSRNFLANHAKLLKPEPWIDRQGRARGNWLAIRDLIRGRMHPEQAQNLLKKPSLGIKSS